jgi:hypothetical protein
MALDLRRAHSCSLRSATAPPSARISSHRMTAGDKDCRHSAKRCDKNCQFLTFVTLWARSEAPPEAFGERPPQY